ncbi:LuxR C-terminal-related transcriptional regulator [Pseudonocardia halophobica]|uniref:Helix-turn-helix transcriptional regulator n=1 Tax=Pseudonocardia halophobica TaxID=29401 RepID=A0A9W6L6R9_9PSEU|nr:LuxR C-terminal-related transcriptional regulator [Pseudonocardia halophobica]GLL13115.1 helix-turn-helix transcriptional regulator [Pseudonocardia halophobica]
MAGRVDRGRVERELVRQCHAGLSLPDLRQRVLRSLRRIVPVAAAFVATADPVTLLFTGAYAEEPLAGSTARFLENEFSGSDVNRFAALATAPRHVSSLDLATRGERAASPRYGEIMLPLGLGDELRAALVAGSECWGYLCLHREDGERGFTRRELELVARVGPHLAAGIRDAAVRAAATAGPDRPGVLLVSDDLALVASTPEARALAELLDDGPGELPVAVQAVAAALLAAERDRGPTPLGCTVRTRPGGWVRLSASRLTGPAGGTGLVSVVLDSTGPGSTTAARLAAHALTPREAEVATLVLRGRSTREISAALLISAHTVQDHLKSVFDKTGVRSRRELVGLLLASPGS